MQIARYRYQNENWHAVFPMQAWQQLYDSKKEEFGTTPHVEFLPTVVAARYALKGETAERAISLHIEESIDDFLHGVNAIVAAQLVNKAIPDRPGILVPSYDRGSFPWIYLLVRGADDKMACQRLVLNILRAQFVGDRYEPAAWQRVLAHIRGEERPDVATKVLRTAESYVHGGVNEFALLLLAIAVEVATSRFVYAALGASGVSRKKLKDIETDLTFSIMLNTQVMALAPSDRKPDSALLGEMDRIRRHRNGLMHKGESSVTNDQMVALADAARRYIDYLSPLTSEAEQSNQDE
jgi:hypothetical protein